MKIALLNVITNGFVKRGKVYADDRYAFNYNRRNGHWTATNIDAENGIVVQRWAMVLGLSPWGT